jgi:hypothetical protein
VAGSVNGVGTMALFNKPSGVAVDLNGTIVVVDRVNPSIRLIKAGQKRSLGVCASEIDLAWCGGLTEL